MNRFKLPSKWGTSLQSFENFNVGHRMRALQRGLHNYFSFLKGFQIKPYLSFGTGISFSKLFQRKRVTFVVNFASILGTIEGIIFTLDNMACPL